MQTTFGGRGGRGGLFGNSIVQGGQPPANGFTSTENTNQNQSIGGHGRGAIGRGGIGRGGFETNENAGQNQPIAGRGRGGFPSTGNTTSQDPPGGLGRGGRGGRGGFGTVPVANENAGQNQPIGGLGFGTIGRGSRGGFGTVPVANENANENQPIAGRGRGISSGRGVMRGGIGTGANAVGMGSNVDQPPMNGPGARDSSRMGNAANIGTTHESTLMNGGTAVSGGGERYVPPKRPLEDLYKEDLDNQMFYRDIAQNDDDVVISGPHAPLKFDAWTELCLDPKLLENIVEHSKYIGPRKIQAPVIPHVLTGSDMKVLSETGSGKTAAFLIPIIQKILLLKQDQPGLLTRNSKPKPIALIVEPTRELCLQVYDQGRKLVNETSIEICKSYGQYSFGASLAEMRAGCDILCATTGRLKHLINDNFIDLSNMLFFVLDEADHLLQKGFLDDIREIIGFEGFPKGDKRQTLLFSATFPQEIQELASEVLRPDSLMASNNKPVCPNNRIEHDFLEVDQQMKTDCLKEILEKVIKDAQEKDPANPKLRLTLVFVRTKRDADRLALYLSENGLKATTLNSDRTQKEREYALSQFRSGDIHVLVSTDVCARGIDIKSLDHVINYDLPTDMVTFVHRIGRTGRLQTGYATSFVDKNTDHSLIPALMEWLQQTGHAIPPFMASDGHHEMQANTFGFTAVQSGNDKSTSDPKGGDNNWVPTAAGNEAKEDWASAGITSAQQNAGYEAINVAPSGGNDGWGQKNAESQGWGQQMEYQQQPMPTYGNDNTPKAADNEWEKETGGW